MREKSFHCHLRAKPGKTCPTSDLCTSKWNFGNNLVPGYKCFLITVHKQECDSKISVRLNEILATLFQGTSALSQQFNKQECDSNNCVWSGCKIIRKKEIERTCKFPVQSIWGWGSSFRGAAFAVTLALNPCRLRRATNGNYVSRTFSGDR
jgi:hypothetical protein